MKIIAHIFEFTAKNMGINVKKYKLIGFMLLHFFVGIMAILTVSYGTTMTALTGMSTMSRNFQPLMGTFFGVAFRKYKMPITAIVVGEFIISIILWSTKRMLMATSTMIPTFILATKLIMLTQFSSKLTMMEKPLLIILTQLIFHIYGLPIY